MDKKKIMIVDDDPDYVIATQTILKRNAFDCICAYSGRESLERLRKARPDLILLDIMMESDNAGIEVVNQLRDQSQGSAFKDYSKIPILIISSLDDIEGTQIQELLKSGLLPVNDFLRKPVPPDQLLDKIKQLIKALALDEYLTKARKPGEDAMQLHPFYQGKIEVTLKAPVRDFKDFAIWYTPGVAEPCKDINKHPEKVFEHTNKSNFIAVISDGTRVLGLGDIGPEAGLPVMEGKALLYKYLGGVDAFPLCLREKDPDRFIDVVKALEPTFGGINLEDIAQPKCFYILDKLRKEMNIPVWHDDQQGTAAVTLAGLINALKVVGKEIDQVRIAMVGAGAANIATLRMMTAYGFPTQNTVLTDLYGTIYPDRPSFLEHFPYEPIRKLIGSTNGQNLRSDDPEKAKSLAIQGADVLICYSQPGPGIISQEQVESMNQDAIVFACANPIPEIWPWEAKEAGARIIATGRGDFPNQVNNSLGFPAIFRGVLDVWARTITDGMCIAAANSLAQSARKKGLSEDYIIPKMDDWEVYIDEAVACGLQAIKDGVARKELSETELRKSAEAKITLSREKTNMLMKTGLVPIPEK
ncbi:response regulator [bacterium]|nr:response regulator [bacterium]